MLKDKVLLRTLSWRLTATITTSIISYLVTGSLSFAGTIMGFEIMSKWILHLTHDTIWKKFE